MASGGSNVNSMTWLPEKLLRSEAFPTDDVSRGRCLPNVRSAVPAKNGRGFFGSCRIPSVDAELRDGPRSSETAPRAECFEMTQAWLGAGEEVAWGHRCGPSTP